MSLKQRYFDSLHNTMDDDCQFILKGLHNWLKDDHLTTLGYEHPNKLRYNKKMVIDNSAFLQNARQTRNGNDCLLHAILVPVLIQSGIPLSILAGECASKEMRIRLTLSVAMNENYFVPNLKSAKKLSANDANTKLPLIRELSRSVHPKKKK